MKQPPVDNDHVANGCEQFSEATIAMNRSERISHTDLMEIKSMMEAASPLPVALGITPEGLATPEQLAEFMRDNFSKGNYMRAWMVYLGKDAPSEVIDDCKVLAVTGNGATSEANARFIVTAFRAMPLLLDEILFHRQCAERFDRGFKRNENNEGDLIDNSGGKVVDENDVVQGC